MNLRPSLQKQHPCKSVPGHHVFKTALGHGDPVFVFGFWQKCQFQFYMWGEMMLQAVAIEIESLPKGLQNYITSTPPKFNIEPENDGLEGEFPFPGVYSQVPS